MSQHREMPRVGSRAYLALQKLHAAGGQASFMDWMTAAGWTGSIQQFSKEVVTSLTVGQKVHMRGSLYVITDAGLMRIGVDVDAPPIVPGVPAGPHYTAPKRPLASRHLVRARVGREGAFDYLAIPSLQGGERVAHKTSLTVLDGDAQG